MRNKVAFLWILCFVLSLTLQAQAKKYAFGDSIYVWASSLNMRESPSQKAKIVGKVPYGAAVVIVDDSIGKVAHRYKAIQEIITIDTNHYVLVERRVDENTTISTPKYHIRKEIEPAFYINGYWVNVNFDGTMGYVFDGYLSKVIPFSILILGFNNDLKEWAINTHHLRLYRKGKQEDNNISRAYMEEYGKPSNKIRIVMGCGESCRCEEIRLRAISLEEGKMLGLQIFGKDNETCRTSVFIEKDYLVIYRQCCC